jgi:hypothetical protein
MKYLFSIILFLTAFSAFSQDRIELGYQSTKRGIVWVRPGLPTHEPAWRISRDTNAILWHDLNTGMRYDWSYEDAVWYAKGTFSSTLPPLPTLTSGAATIDNRTAFWLNAANTLHRYDKTQTAWVPFKQSFQSSSPSNVSAGVGNGAAVYTTSLWQDSDDYLVYYWDGDSWELLSGPPTNLTYTGTSSPLTLNSSTGTDVTITAGTGISLAASSTNLTITNTGASLWTDGGATTYLTATGDNVAIGGTSATQKLDVTGSIKGSADLYLGSAFKIYDNGSLIWHRSGSYQSLFVGTPVGATANTGNRNYGFGTNNFVSLTSGEQNVAIGGTVLYALTTGSANVGIGVNVMQNLTTGNSNMSIGGSSGSAITTGFGNCLIGSGAGGSITTGSYNMAIGTNALRTATTQEYNAAIGFQALYSNSPSFSVAIGSESGYGGVNRLNGLYLGAYAGYSATAATQIAIGYGAGFGSTIDQTLAIDYNPSFVSDATPLISGNFSTDRVGINTAHASLAQTFNVTGTARITGSDGTATTVMGRDGDGDISALSLSGMSISSGTLTATDGSTTNELQTIANTSDATSHTVTLSNSGGSVQLVEGSGVTLTTTGTSGAGVVTIAATGAGTDLSFSGASSPVTLNSSTGTDVTITAGGINTLSASGTNITITGTEVDGSTTNELQTYGHAGTTTYTNTLSGGGGSWSITGAGIAAISQTGGAITVTATEVDGSTTNELQTISVASNTTTLSNSGGSMTIAGAGINTVGTAGSTITITGTEVDGSISNEGSLTVGAGSGTTSIINSNTSGSTGVTLTAGSGLTISETGNVITLANSAPDQTVSITGAGINAVTGTYPNFTITGTEVDGSVTNEAQSLTVTGTTSGTITLSTAGGAGGGAAVIAAGTGITIGQSGGTITVTNSSPATAGWLLDGNTITAAKRIGSNDNFDVVVETNNTDRMWVDNAGTVSIGATQLTTAALNINGLQTGTGMLIAGGGSLTGPNFYTATGSGTGSTATILSGVVSMISGNVEALLKNTATAGTGGGSVITLNVSPTASSNDPFIKWQTEATTDWSMGIDNDDVDNLNFTVFPALQTIMEKARLSLGMTEQ